MDDHPAPGHQRIQSVARPSRPSGDLVSGDLPRENWAEQFPRDLLGYGGLIVPQVAPGRVVHWSARVSGRVEVQDVGSWRAGCHAVVAHGQVEHQVDVPIRVVVGEQGRPRIAGQAGVAQIGSDRRQRRAIVVDVTLVAERLPTRGQKLAVADGAG